jgi:hypothetical protein
MSSVYPPSTGLASRERDIRYTGIVVLIWHDVHTAYRLQLGSDLFLYPRGWILAHRPFDEVDIRCPPLGRNSVRPRDRLIKVSLSLRIIREDEF